MPDADALRGWRPWNEAFGTDRSDQRQQPGAITKPAFALVEAVSKILVDLGVLFIAWAVFDVGGDDGAGHTVSLREADPNSLPLRIFPLSRRCPGRADALMPTMSTERCEGL